MATEKAKLKLTKRTPKKKVAQQIPQTPQVDTSWHAKFLAILSTTCNVTLAARGAGIARVTAYEHYRLLPDFKAAWDDAKEAAVEILEAEAAMPGLAALEAEAAESAERIRIRITDQVEFEG